MTTDEPTTIPARKGCRGCKHYSASLQRCKLGRVDPKCIGEGVKAAKMGLLNPCPLTVRGQKVLTKLASAAS